MFIGILFSAVCMFWMFQEGFLGSETVMNFKSPLPVLKIWRKQLPSFF